MLEQWHSLSFLGYPDYEVSSYGNYVGPRGEMLGHVHRGRHRIRLCSDIIGPKDFQTAWVVAMCFVPNPGKLSYVRHRDTDTLNNHVGNLYWSNQQHSNGAKLTWDIVAEIRKCFKKGDKVYGINALARKYGVDSTAISNIIYERTWKE